MCVFLYHTSDHSQGQSPPAVESGHSSFVGTASPANAAKTLASPSKCKSSELSARQDQVILGAPFPSAESNGEQAVQQRTLHSPVGKPKLLSNNSCSKTELFEYCGSLPAHAAAAYRTMLLSEHPSGPKQFIETVKASCAESATRASQEHKHEESQPDLLPHHWQERAAHSGFPASLETSGPSILSTSQPPLWSQDASTENPRKVEGQRTQSSSNERLLYSNSLSWSLRPAESRCCPRRFAVGHQLEPCKSESAAGIQDAATYHEHQPRCKREAFLNTLRNATPCSVHCSCPTHPFTQTQEQSGLHNDCSCGACKPSRRTVAVLAASHGNSWDEGLKSSTAASHRASRSIDISNELPERHRSSSCVPGYCTLSPCSRDPARCPGNLEMHADCKDGKAPQPSHSEQEAPHSDSSRDVFRQKEYSPAKFLVQPESVYRVRTGTARDSSQLRDPSNSTQCHSRPEESPTYPTERPQGAPAEGCAIHQMQLLQEEWTTTPPVSLTVCGRQQGLDIHMGRHGGPDSQQNAEFLLECRGAPQLSSCSTGCKAFAGLTDNNENPTISTILTGSTTLPSGKSPSVVYQHSCSSTSIAAAGDAGTPKASSPPSNTPSPESVQFSVSEDSRCFTPKDPASNWCMGEGACPRKANACIPDVLHRELNLDSADAVRAGTPAKSEGPIASTGDPTGLVMFGVQPSLSVLSIAARIIQRHWSQARYRLREKRKAAALKEFAVVRQTLEQQNDHRHSPPLLSPCGRTVKERCEVATKGCLQPGLPGRSRSAALVAHAATGASRSASLAPVTVTHGSSIEAPPKESPAPIKKVQSAKACISSHLSTLMSRRQSHSASEIFAANKSSSAAAFAKNDEAEETEKQDCHHSAKEECPKARSSSLHGSVCSCSDAEFAALLQEAEVHDRCKSPEHPGCSWDKYLSPKFSNAQESNADIAKQDRYSEACQILEGHEDKAHRRRSLPQVIAGNFVSPQPSLEALLLPHEAPSEVCNEASIEARRYLPAAPTGYAYVLSAEAMLDSSSASELDISKNQILHHCPLHLTANHKQVHQIQRQQ